MEDARCAYMGDPEMFFPTAGESLSGVRRFCLECPVRMECAEFAIARPYLYGVWGGLTKDERAAIRRQRRRVA